MDHLLLIQGEGIQLHININFLWKYSLHQVLVDTHTHQYEANHFHQMFLAPQSSFESLLSVRISLALVKYPHLNYVVMPSVPNVETQQSDKPLTVQQQEKFLQEKCFFLESLQIFLHVGLSSVLIHPNLPLHVGQPSRYLRAWVGSQSYYNNPCEMLGHHHKHHPQDTIRSEERRVGKECKTLYKTDN